MSTAVPVERVVELTQLLYHEAELLDRGAYEDWLALLAPEVRYRAPIPDDTDPAVTPSVPAAGTGTAATVGGTAPELQLRYFDDDLGLLRLRVGKIRSGLLQSENPPSRCVRLIGNVQVLAETGPGEHPVRSAFVLYRSRRQRQIELLAGHRHDRWRRDGDGWLLARREVFFAANVLPTKTLSLLY